MKNYLSKTGMTLSLFLMAGNSYAHHDEFAISAWMHDLFHALSHPLAIAALVLILFIALKQAGKSR